MNMLQHIKRHVTGMFMIFLVMLAFSALNWITLGETNLVYERVTLPAIITVIVWFLSYFGRRIIWAVLLFLATITAILWGVGLLFGLAGVGYITMLLVQYVLPAGWVTFTGDGVLHFVMGCVFTGIVLYLSPSKPDFSISVNTKS